MMLNESLLDMLGFKRETEKCFMFKCPMDSRIDIVILRRENGEFTSQDSIRTLSSIRDVIEHVANTTREDTLFFVRENVEDTLNKVLSPEMAKLIAGEICS